MKDRLIERNKKYLDVTTGKKQARRKRGSRTAEMHIDTIRKIEQARSKN